MNNEDKNSVSFNLKNKNIDYKSAYTLEKALKEFDELKNIALCCVDKNGNPNITAAIRAIENKAKIAGLYGNKKDIENKTIVNMSQITIDGEQLKLKIGDEFIQ